MFKQFVTKNTNLVSIIIFLVLFTLIIYIKPNFAFNDKGQIRPFGLGYKNKTILPIWLIVIIISIICYMGVFIFINKKVYF